MGGDSSSVAAQLSGGTSFTEFIRFNDDDRHEVADYLRQQNEQRQDQHERARAHRVDRGEVARAKDGLAAVRLRRGGRSSRRRRRWWKQRWEGGPSARLQPQLERGRDLGRSSEIAPAATA